MSPAGPPSVTSGSKTSAQPAASASPIGHLFHNKGAALCSIMISKFFEAIWSCDIHTISFRDYAILMLRYKRTVICDYCTIAAALN